MHSDSEEEQEAIKAKGIKKIKEEIDSEEDEDDSQEESEEEDEDVIKMDFEDGSKPSSKQDNKKTKKGIMGLKFMQLAQEKEKEQLKNQANLLVKQIKGEDDYEEDDDENSSDGDKKEEKFISSAAKFGAKPLKQKKVSQDAKPLGQEAVIKAARAVTGNADSDQSSSSEDEEP